MLRIINMKYLVYILGWLWVLSSCSPEPITSRQIAEKCQAYHITEGQWYDKDFTLQLESKSVFSDNNTEIIKLRMDNPANTFEYNNTFRGVHLEYQPGNCIAHNDSSSCEDYEWAYRFYPYIWGMPAKFFDPGVQVKEGFKEVIINEVPVYVIHIEYEKENWDYYINKDSYYLEGFKFVKKDGSGGEIVYNEGTKLVNGIIMSTKRTWYDLDMKLLGTDILK